MYAVNCYMTVLTILYIIIIVPPLTLVITPSGPPNEGQTYSLTCDLMGDELLDVTDANIEFRWCRINTQQTIIREATLLFDSLSHEDEGQYECTINIVSPYTTDTLSKVKGASITVIRKQEIKPFLV